MRNVAAVDALERSQIRLILEHNSSQMCSKSQERHKAMHADRAAARALGSGDIIRRALKLVEADAREFITTSVDQVANVAQDSDAFALIVGSVTALFRHFEAQVEKAVILATRGGTSPRYTGAKREADRLFAELRDHMFRELEIHRFSFTKPSKSRMLEIRESINLQPKNAEQALPKNYGGKPLAEHWDSMWADIAVALWVGDLSPKSQAEVKAAIFEWFNKKGIDVGETAVRQRAQKLWSKIEASE